MTMYKIIDESCVCRVGDGLYIPRDEQNSDYRVYMEWLAEGNLPIPKDDLPQEGHS